MEHEQVLEATTMQPQAISARTAALSSVALGVIGIAAVLPVAVSLWDVWTTVPLKSIGAFVPVVSLLLILRVWRSLGWQVEGSWWGLAIVAVTVALVHLRQVAMIELVISQSTVIWIPPFPVVAVAYVAGVVLLFGGWRLLSRARFPVAFMWLVSPVPKIFSTHFDLPLQHISSMVARGFAHALGQQLTSDQLLLMFTPQFGMFIAPGCNGIRGAVTLGMIALVAGYLYRFKPSVTVAVVACSVLVGYVFNFLRLCGLVLYYLVALHIPWLQSRATMGDYVIGAVLFAVATWGLFTAIRLLGESGDLWPPELPRVAEAATPVAQQRRWLLQGSMFLVLVVAGSFSYAQELLQRDQQAALPALGVFPQQVGAFHLIARHNETMLQGPQLFYWGDYTNGAGDTVSVAVSPNFGAHDSIACRYARGEGSIWRGNLPMNTAQGEVGFSGAFYLDDTQEVEEATTVCTGESCGQYSDDVKQFGLIYSVPRTNVLLNPSPTRPIPVMLHATTTNTHLEPAEARHQLEDTLRAFLAGANIAAFTQPYRKQ